MKDIEFGIDGTYYREKEENLTIFQKSFEKKVSVLMFVLSDFVLAKRLVLNVAGSKIIIKRSYIRKYYYQNKVSKKVSDDHYTTESFYKADGMEGIIFVSKNITTDPNGNVHVSDSILSKDKTHYMFMRSSFIQILLTKRDFAEILKCWQVSKVNSRISRVLSENIVIKDKIELLHKQAISNETGIAIHNLHKVHVDIFNDVQARDLLMSFKNNALKD